MGLLSTRDHQSGVDAGKVSEGYGSSAASLLSKLSQASRELPTQIAAWIGHSTSRAFFRKLIQHLVSISHILKHLLQCLRHLASVILRLVARILLRGRGANLEGGLQLRISSLHNLWPSSAIREAHRAIGKRSAHGSTVARPRYVCCGKLQAIDLGLTSTSTRTVGNDGFIHWIRHSARVVGAIRKIEFFSMPMSNSVRLGMI